MVRIMITSGPTRQYLDPVRYLTNGSSGRMGRSLAQAALELGYQVVIITGPVEIEYPTRAEVVPVISTEELLEACQRTFPTCDGTIAAAAPCDYRPVRIAAQKITKTGSPIELQMVETPDVVAALGSTKRIDQWIVGFALETEDQRLRALAKLEKKSCDLMVLNGPEAMNSKRNQVEIIDRRGNLIDALAGPKEEVARGILQVVQKRLIEPHRSRFELTKERGAAVPG
jgi:phosphopantothenoylcysteine decarboxylase / phosphopantothenate---cysteine ligase